MEKTTEVQHAGFHPSFCCCVARKNPEPGYEANDLSTKFDFTLGLNSWDNVSLFRKLKSSYISKGLNNESRHACTCGSLASKLNLFPVTYFNRVTVFKVLYL